MIEEEVDLIKAATFPWEREMEMAIKTKEGLRSKRTINNPID